MESDDGCEDDAKAKSGAAPAKATVSPYIYITASRRLASRTPRPCLCYHSRRPSSANRRPFHNRTTLTHCQSTNSLPFY